MTKLIIEVSDDKKLSLNQEGEPMHPIEMLKVLCVFQNDLLANFKIEEPSKIIKPDRVIH